MKALIILNLEDCTFDEIEEAEIKEISLIYQDKETGKKCDFLWETGFEIIPMPNEREEKDHYDFGWNDCVRVLNGDYNLCKLG